MISVINGTICLDGLMMTRKEAADYALSIIDTKPEKALAIARACRTAEEQVETIMGNLGLRHGRELTAQDSGMDERGLEN